MSILRVRRSYKRIRVDNRFTYPVFFFLLDFLLSLLKILAVGLALALAIAWLVYNRSFGEQPMIDQGAVINVVSQSDEVKYKSDKEKQVEERDLVSREEFQVVPAVARTMEYDRGVLDQSLVANPPRSSDPLSLMDNNWILGESEPGYTVQLGSSTEKTKLVDFAKEFGLDEQLHVYVYKLTPGGKPVYGLAFGVYADFEIAKEVIDELPASMREYEPWIRPIEALQIQIKTVQ